MDIDYLYNEYKSSAGISTDTRNIHPNQIFFALRGPNFNANILAPEAIRKGARLAIIDDPKFTNEKTLLVEDALDALQKLALYHRDRLSIPVFGLTGSNGKTTTKELIKAVLEKKYKIFATQGNFNNHIGVPLTLLSIDDTHEMAVVEMGANHIGEIANLCAIAKPTHGLITNIGKAHIGEFGGFENIIRAKSELFDYLIKNNGIIFLNMLDSLLSNMSKRFKEYYSYPQGEICDIQLIDADPYVKIRSKGNDYQTNLIGAYNFPNMAAAICVGSFFKVDSGDVMEAVSKYTSSNNRSQIVEAGTNTIILDAYNANPSSMEEAVKNFGAMTSNKVKVVILGDMLELGEDTEEEHRQLAKNVASHSFDEVIYVGPLMEHAFAEHPSSKHFKNTKALIDHLGRERITNALILIKGSRGMALEGALEALKEH